MKTQPLSTSVSITSGSTILHGAWLWLVRIAWLVLVIIAMSLFLRGIPLRAENMRNAYRPTTGTDLSWNRMGEIAISPWWDYSAYQAGLLEGDILMAVNGAEPRLKPGDSLDKLIPDGAAGTPVTLRVRTGNHPAREYKIYYGGENPIALAKLGISNDFMANFTVAIEISFALICFGIAGIIFLRKSNDWLALLVSFAFIMVLSANMAVTLDGAEPLWRPAIRIWYSLTIFVSLLFLYFFPVGQKVPRWTWVLVLAAAVWTVLQWLDPRFQPYRAQAPASASSASFLIFLSWFSTGIFTQFYHYRYSNSIQKQQTKWVIFGALVWFIGVMGRVASLTWHVPSGFPTVLFDLLGYPAILVFILFLPVTIAIAILRYRLWDIDIIINRTLVYGALTASVIGIYVLVVGILGTTIQGRANLLISILATGFVAILVQPLRDRLQRGINRMMYGERDDPITVLSRLGQRLEGTLAPDAVLPSLVETVAQTLKLPYVAIEMTTDSHSESQMTNDSSPISLTYPIIAYGNPQPDVIRLPLIYQSESIGQLVVSPRAPDEALSPMDHHLLENIAHQAGMAVHSVNLTTDLQRSREKLVLAREEERRRLRRDLHDDLAPTLASLGLTASTAADLISTNPATAAKLVKELQTEIRATVGNIRRLVYDLRPPTLDELGLVAAVRERAAQYSNAPEGFHVTVDAPNELPALPAAVEVATYRIVQEALENVSKHSQARTCSIRFANHNGLEIEITDDGIGLPPKITPGVGLRSMRERAEELGGSYLIERCVDGGTRILAHLPIGEFNGSVARLDRG